MNHKDHPLNSTVIARTIDGMRVALAGLPAATPVIIGEGLLITAATVADMRALDSIPGELQILIPYQRLPDIVVMVNLYTPEWEQQSER